MRPLLLDLCCGAGGCSRGYYEAGFDVIGVDINPMPRYPYTFIQADMLESLDQEDLSKYTAIHASPPCQSYSSSRHFKGANTIPAPKLIIPVRERLVASGLPWIIENVVGSELPDAFELCGSMFGLPIQRHRWFSSSHLIFVPGTCQHARGFYNVVGGKVRGYGDFATEQTYQCANGQVRRREGFYRREIGAAAMGINWMTVSELCQAIPPAYCRYIGTQLLSMIDLKEVTA